MGWVQDILQLTEDRVSDKGIITSVDLSPLTHQEREELADLLSESFFVKVNRFGTGNALHSFGMPGCGVSSIEVRRKPSPEVKKENDEIGKYKQAVKHLSEIIRNKCDDGSLRLLTNKETRRMLCDEFGFDYPISKNEILELAYKNIDLMIKLVYHAPMVMINPSTMGANILQRMGDGSPVKTRKDRKLFEKHYENRDHPIVSDSGYILNKPIDEGGDGMYMYCQVKLSKRERDKRGIGPSEKLAAFRSTK